jgi:hypothetical protein
MMVDNLPPLVTKEIDAICRKFLWVGNDALVHDKCLVAWKIACRTTELGGLGITDLKLVGYALQTRWLWLQKTDSSRKLPINADTQVRAFFCASTYTELGDDANALFWDDRWLQQTTPSDIAPNLVQLVSRSIRSILTVLQGLTNRWTRAITGSMSTAAIAEFLDLWEATADVNLREEQNMTVWRWTPDGKYSAKSAYKMLHIGSIPLRGHSLIWKTWALKVKIFLWLSFRKRHWTNDRRARHGLEAREEGYLCD